ncbi:ferredoxin family protein [Neobittarella massiliensis]|uniref:4Fe-4S binding protein n=2 Tax=Oscillospiraceae TaxID=216572 RepID=A0A8J6IPG4_9FIRM|nr:4Fe-4S binding protein [Neobittarella massiliensis]MBC3516397.1 4Fe-4S binding protein [Neobittarella massiliensis]SCJ87675.1 Ferredoxin III [uncultured Anaerotruncus sp.]
MAKITVNTDLCKGCGLCVQACPKQIIALAQELLNAKGYHPAQCIDEGACIGCAMCATMCPDVAITVER